ncbi:hypothetical protein HYW43_04445 [Candidatus Daviesbacteria bacterium]|nr:hypothetical protein [Candidatus Daviesbacteria bacterium]
MIYILFFLLEIGILFFLSKKLINSLARILFKFTHNRQLVVNILAILFLPGTIIHELAHLLMAGIMLIPVGEMTVVPEVLEDGVKLGGVQIGKSDPFRRTLVAVAPVLVGIAAILGILYFAQIDNYGVWQIALALYLIFEIGNTMFSSKKDLEGVIGFVVAILLIIFIVSAAFYLLKPGLIQTLWSYLQTVNFDPAISFFKKSSIYLMVPLGLDLLVILFTIPFTKALRP